MALAEQEYDEARQALEESISTFLDIKQQMHTAMPLASLVYVDRALGNLHQARQRLDKALQVVTKTNVAKVLPLALPAVALLLADQGEKERAIELYTLASRYPYVANSRWFEDVAGRHIAAVAATLPPEVVAAAQERGRARDLWQTAEELLKELETER